MLKDIIAHMGRDRAYEKHMPQLLSILHKIMSHMHNFSDIFGMDRFMPFVDLFLKDKIKGEVCKLILENFATHQKEPTSDPVVLNGLMYLGRVLHDSINSMTYEDERKQISSLIVAFLSKSDFGRDFELTLNFFVDARASFSNMDNALVYLVHRANRLIMQTHQIVQGNHTRKTAQFVRTCVAYNFITIPSIGDVFKRLYLYIDSGCVAIVNQALSQGESFFRSAVTQVAEVPQELDEDGENVRTEDRLVKYVIDLMSSLLLVPDDPEAAPLSLFRDLMEIVSKYPWHSGAVSPVKIYSAAIPLLAAYSQPKYIYNVAAVDLNDRLYAASGKFLAEVNKLAAALLTQSLTLLQSIEPTKSVRSAVAMELFERLLLAADLNEPSMVKLLKAIYETGRSGNVDRPSWERTSKLLHNIQLPHIDAVRAVCV